MHTYELAICELVHPRLHGANAIGANAIGANAIGANAIGANAIDINNHFLIYATFAADEFYDNSYKEDETFVRRRRQKESRVLQLNETHPTLRKYNQHYIRLEIFHYIHVNANGSEYHVGILKTFWLRIVQRRWKKVFKARKDMSIKRGSIAALQEKQRTGMWPAPLRTWPRFTLH